MTKSTLTQDFSCGHTTKIFSFHSDASKAPLLSDRHERLETPCPECSSKRLGAREKISELWGRLTGKDGYRKL